jgi:hypothetical protein
LDNEKAFDKNNFEEYILSNLFSDGRVEFKVKEDSLEKSDDID